MLKFFQIFMQVFCLDTTFETITMQIRQFYYFFFQNVHEGLQNKFHTLQISVRKNLKILLGRFVIGHFELVLEKTLKVSLAKQTQIEKLTKWSIRAKFFHFAI